MSGSDLEFVLLRRKFVATEWPVLICRQLIECEGDYQLFKKESAQKGYKNDLLVC